jgi:Polyketide cyclase / dehydrase and lipid transport
MKSALIIAFCFFLGACTSPEESRPMQNDALAEGTNRSFSHTVVTQAKPDTIWRLWIDASSWKYWDKGLKDAELIGPMTLGSKGRIIPLSGPPATFEITAFEPMRTYTMTTHLPFARLIVRRSIVGEAPTIFRHDVRFEGPLSGLWAGQFGPAFRAALPPTMTALSERATSGAPATP